MRVMVFVSYLAASLPSSVLSAESSAQTHPDDMPTEFEYRGEDYVEQPFNELFDRNTFVGAERRRLFETYLNSPEGQDRQRRAGNADPGSVWRNLTAEERTTFLAVTHALGHVLSDWPDGSESKLLNWVERLDKIRGAVTNRDGGVEGSLSYRLYAHVPRAYFEHIKRKWALSKDCEDPGIRYDGGSPVNHMEFCRPGKRFEDDKKLELEPARVPSIQINFTDSTECVDIDIDFHPPGLGCHLKADNSNVLAFLCSREHLEEFDGAYCNSGFSRRKRP